jgi:hypothetical protein
LKNVFIPLMNGWKKVPAPPCGSAATKADMKKRRMAPLPCKVVEPTREKSPPLILAGRLLQALG